MAASTLTLYPVDNGAMALLKLNDDHETTILVDIRIRDDADDPDGEYFDVAAHLREQLSTDDDGRPCVDAFVLTNHDDDHILGLQRHFHLGPLDDYLFPEDEDEPLPIVIREMLCTPRFWKAASRSHPLSSDAKAWDREMRRRVGLFQATGLIQSEGERAQILGEDEDGKTDDLVAIVKPIDSAFSVVNERDLSGKLRLELLGPLPQQDGEPDEDYASKNRASVLLQATVHERSATAEYDSRISLTGDAEVYVWEKMWEKHGECESLSYDVLAVPHHCSWRSLSHDSESECDDPRVSKNARSALKQARSGALAVSSSKPIKDDGQSPPSVRAKKEYVAIVGEERFLCTGEHPSEDDVRPIVISLTADGPQRRISQSRPRTSKVAAAATGTAFPHGRPSH